MRLELTRHPDRPCESVRRIAVEVARRGLARLDLRYVVTGEAAGLVLPPPAAPERTDELWRRTCFEAFIAGPGEAYCEFNLAPSTQWAAWRFEAYRDGMAPLDMVAAPRIELRRSGDGLGLSAVLDLEAANLPGDEPWRIGLSAVIEESGGRISYWALAHPPGKPDFHHPDCFALELPAPEDA